MRFRKIWMIALLTPLLALSAATGAAAQAYVIEPGDKINVSFWQEPTLNVEEIVVDSQGNIDIPIAGRIMAAGLNVPQLEAKIVEKINIYNREITQALVKVIEYGSKKIFITGSVVLPGPVTFESMPNVWEAILQAGGPLEDAQLDQVTIVRGSGSYGQTIPVNLLAYFDQQDLSKLPELRPKDNIHVPGRGGNGSAGSAGVGGDRTPKGLFSRSAAVYVYGAVVQPGRYELEQGMDVLQAVILAGGPNYGASAGAETRGPAPRPNLNQVRIISQTEQGSVVYEVDIERYSKEAVPQPLLLRPGDTIFLPTKESYSKFLLSNTLRTVITSTASILVSYFILNEVLNTGGSNTAASTSTP